MSNAPKARAPHDEPYCLVLWLESDEAAIMMRIPETFASLARRRGWHVLARESEIPYHEITTEPSQRNPNRSGDA